MDASGTPDATGGPFIRPKDIIVRVVEGIDAQIAPAIRDTQSLNYRIKSNKY